MANDFGRYGLGIALTGKLADAFKSYYDTNTQRDLTREELAERRRQFDENAAFTKEGRDWTRDFSILGAKQSAEAKVAEDEAYKLYGEKGIVRKKLNPDGYSFTYTPDKMNDIEYKAFKQKNMNVGGYGSNVPKDTSTKLGTVLGAYTYMGPETGWMLTADVNPPAPVKTEYSQLLRDLTVANRDRFKNAGKGVQTYTNQNRPWYDTSVQDEYAKKTYLDLYKQADTRLGAAFPWVVGRLGYAGYEGVIKPTHQLIQGTRAAGRGTVNMWNYLTKPVKWGDE